MCFTYDNLYIIKEVYLLQFFSSSSLRSLTLIFNFIPLFTSLLLSALLFSPFFFSSYHFILSRFSRFDYQMKRNGPSPSYRSLLATLPLQVNKRKRLREKTRGNEEVNGRQHEWKKKIEKSRKE